jgi:hypothetical protein
MSVKNSKSMDKTDAIMEKTGKKRAQQPRWKQKWKSVVEEDVLNT